jgi:hypothetical protein
MSSSTPEKAPKVDTEIGKQGFKSTRQFIVIVEYEGEAYTKDEFESNLPTEIEPKNFEEYGVNGSFVKMEYSKCYHESHEYDSFTKEHKKLDSTIKFKECIPEKYIDNTDTNPIVEKEDYSCGEWVSEDYEYKKNEDGTDIK